MTNLEEMVLPKDKSSAHRSRTVIRHRFLSSCNYKIYCKLCYPSIIASDNDKSFGCAAKGMKAFLEESDKAEIESDLAPKKIV